MYFQCENKSNDEWLFSGVGTGANFENVIHCFHLY